MPLKLKFEDVDYTLVDRMAQEIHEKAKAGDVAQTIEWGQKLLACPYFKSVVDGHLEASEPFVDIVTLLEGPQGIHKVLPSIVNSALRMGLMIGLRYHEEKEREALDRMAL